MAGKILCMYFIFCVRKYKVRVTTVLLNLLRIMQSLKFVILQNRQVFSNLFGIVLTSLL